METKHIEIYFDGSCINNPGGQMGFGVVFIDLQTKERFEINDGENAYIGNTNNVAEYRALLLGLNKLSNYNFCNVTIKGDSQLVINQISGKWKVKNNNKFFYTEYALEALETIKSLFTNNHIKFRFEWIPRELNEDADRLSNIYHSSLDIDYRDMVKRMSF